MIVGSIASTGGDQFPENVVFRENVMDAFTPEDYAYKENNQHNPDMVDNMAWVGNASCQFKYV